MVAEQKKSLAILGSTGSVGRKVLEVVRAHPELYSIEVLTAHNNAGLLISQTLEFQPDAVVIGNKSLYRPVKEALDHLPVKVFAGTDAIAQLMEFDSFSMVCNAISGIAGLEATITAIKHNKSLALANKEVMVVAGHLITKLADEYGVQLFPVDSEHSAIFQCLVGELFNPVEKIYLTASGGPFRGKKTDFLRHVTKEEALKHPNWDMGTKISIDSATLMNKGLEVIEARWFFGLKPEQIEVIIHPQSIVHSMVQFQDGSIKAQMGLPDMRLPIQYALSYPKRILSPFERFSFMDHPLLSFEKPDINHFPCLGLAYEALEQGGLMPCILNAANEAAVELFLNGDIGFTQIPSIIERSMEQASNVDDPDSEQIYQTHHHTKASVLDMV